ncbi:glycoside hydrolase family 95 protein [uncultured Bacteroides sp.]|uniref:glycoside hydrolase family 95 protein n=1 Tax=uncultured Bacteroides sp. TaxID=162156 RepID=UPI002AA6885C|nr:glycoside hydrolase family 95 protein [uncultured Bacteroides sp.]
MKNLNSLNNLIIGVTIALIGYTEPANALTLTKLWYDKPADEWMKSIPVGNGRLGAMMYGGVENETLALNESTMWSGEYDPNQQKPFGREKLNALRKLFFEGKLVEGNRIAGDNLAGTPHSFGTHLPVGDLKMHFVYPHGEVTEYRRELDMATALSSVTYKVGDVRYTRACFASNPDDVLAYHISASRPGAINMELHLDLLRKADIIGINNQLVYSGKVDFPKQGPGGVSFEGRVSVSITDGDLNTTDKTLIIKGATKVTILMDIRTDYKSTTYSDAHYKQHCKRTIEKAAAKSFEELKKEHIADYAPLFARVDLALDKGENNHLTTEERWLRVRRGASDPGLEALFFQYGRYLLISSSRPNSPLPVALQGFFNDNLACNMGWTNDYHLDINTEQNYWIANVGNLAECNVPLFNYIKDLSVHGAKTARVVYGCKGWVAHTTANAWGYTPSSGSIFWGLFPTAGSWLASHLWSNYEYTQDSDYLGRVAYPLLKGNAKFLLDYMVKDPETGQLLTGPSISPENSFRYDGQELVASMMPTCDRELVYEIFSSCVQAANILNTDQAFADSLRTAIAQLPPIPIAANGTVQEWHQNFEEAHPNHRHTSHLLALYPFAQITLQKTPELAVAARKTIEKRLSTPDWEDTEWSRANLICFYARLKDPQRAYSSVKMLLNTFTRENLLSMSPKGIAGAPYDIFIFDGNAAGAAGIAEMLVQSHEGYIELLPCLPREWKDGQFKGLCVRGGAEVSVSWKDAMVQKASLKATASNTFYMQLPVGRKYSIRLNGKKVTPVNTNGRIKVRMKVNDLLEIK